MSGYNTVSYKSGLDAEDYSLPKSENMIQQYKKWIAFWRENPHRFVKDYLGIKSLKPFQEYLLYQMIHGKNFMYLAARGQGKTFLTALFVVIVCILYPGTKVVVASGKKGQAMKIVTEKLPELMAMSPIIKNELDGRPKSNMNSDDPNIKFLNGSWVKIVASNEGARSSRANLLILDEFILIEQNIYNKVLRRFVTNTRQPNYLSIDKYSTKEYRELEKNRQIFLSSAGYKHNWGYKHFLTFVKRMTDGSFYNVIAFPYQKSIEHGFLVEEDIREEMKEDTFSPVGFNMEMECMFYGENEDAFFELSDIEDNRKIIEALYPKEIYQIYGNKNFKPREKDRDEIRIITNDIARLPSKKNDASAFTILSLRRYNNNWKIHGEYMESLVGGHSKTQAIRIRQLYNDFDCDYIVTDVKGNAISVVDRLLEPLFDKERGVKYEAFKFINHDKLNESALHNAEERIFAIDATADLNMKIANTLRDYLKRGKFRFLVNGNDSLNYVTKAKDYSKLSIEKQSMLQKPYIQFDNFVNETISLKLDTSAKTNVERLIEPRSGRKDRYSSLSYGVYFLSLKEKELTKPQNNEDWDNFMLF